MDVLLFIGASASIMASLIIAMRSENSITQILAGFAAGFALAALETGKLTHLLYPLMSLALAILYEQLQRSESNDVQRCLRVCEEN